MGFVNNIIKRLKTDKRFAKMFYIAAAVLVIVIVVIAACVSCSSDNEATEDGTQQEAVVEGEAAENADGAAEETTEPAVDYTVPDVALEENAYPQVNDLVAKYFNAMTNGDSATITSLRDTISQEELIKIEKESAYIDEFDGIKVYTKPGPMSGSYVAFIYYEIKFSGIETAAPGLSTFYLCPREDGSLYICDGNMTQQDTDYVKAIVAQTDVADLFARVETKYAEAMDADASLNEFMVGLSEKLDAEVSQAMAELQPEEAPQQEETAEQPQSQVVEELVKATDTVNVRASDSENADRVGRVAMGETVTRYEKKENGWSRVDYNGTEGYIKSEYLEVVGGSDNSETETEPQEQEEEQEDAPTTDITANGTVTIKEAVNVRKSASTSADKLGMAYKGETYDLIMEQADGWCKIKYKGEVGYVKTEFVE